MTTFVEFLAGNLLALGVVALVAVALAGVFAMGGVRRSAPNPTRPIAAAMDLAATDDAVAVVGTPDCEVPLRAPFVDEPSVAYQVAVSGRIGTVALVADGTSFALDVDGERVRVDAASSPSPVVDDERHEHVRKGNSPDDFDAATVDDLAAQDAERSRLARVLSGRLLPKYDARTYRLRYASTTDEVAVVGHLERDADGWRLEPREGESLRFLDPDAVLDSDAVGQGDAVADRT